MATNQNQQRRNDLIGPGQPYGDEERDHRPVSASRADDLMKKKNESFGLR